MLQTVASLPYRQCPAQGLFFLDRSLQQSLRQFGASVGAQSHYLHKPHHKSHHIYIYVYMYPESPKLVNLLRALIYVIPKK